MGEYIGLMGNKLNNNPFYISKLLMLDRLYHMLVKT